MVLVVIKALDILEYLAQTPNRAFTLTEISESLNLNQATCANILKTLVSKNFVEHLGRRKGYKLGPMAFNLTNNLDYNREIIVAAKDVMLEITEELNETSLLGVLRNQKRYILHLVNSDQDLQVRSHTERDVYETATGRLLLAYLPKKERDNFINAHGIPSSNVWKEASERDSLEAALNKAVSEELVISRSAKHIIGLAVPIRKKEKVIAAIGVFLPEIRFTPLRKKEIIQALRRGSAAINERLASEYE